MAEWIAEERQIIRIDGASIGVELRKKKEFIRCKDCKYYCPQIVILKCNMEHLTNGDDWYCADAERKGREDNG